MYNVADILDSNPSVWSRSSRNLKFSATIIFSTAIVIYIVIIFSVYLGSDYNPKNIDKWLLSSALYTIETGQLAVNYQDIGGHTKYVDVSMTKDDGERWNVGNFTGYQQSIILINVNETPSLPNEVTFNIILVDGTKISKTIDVEVRDTLSGNIVNSNSPA